MAEAVSYENAEKNYPKASKSALVKIRNQELEKSEIEKNQSGLIQGNSYFNEENSLNIKNIKPSRPQTGKIRPTSAVTDHHKTVYNSTASVKNLMFSQPIYQNSTQNLNFVSQTGPEKVKLYSAYTLGYTLVPIIVKRPQTVKSKLFNPPTIMKIQNTTVKSNTTNETFAQKVRKGRPDSPNPAEVWARKKGVSLQKISISNNENTLDL